MTIEPISTALLMVFPPVFLAGVYLFSADACRRRRAWRLIGIALGPAGGPEHRR
ncbi:hypothetical protein [Actinoplanes teichomyceticus]|uniref:Uncharacterized protein n=1 Tax=Actinoplanes teichomyceticus TaxID=1867 RepID=A0A561VCP9_ACTTI|nr:hypothetical protein [Actinoplanes teichomyceticus]TWG09388.1 hypothetical protein FHX34_108103 [Actinoplanes teichomyceticus]GIF17029.1 hypothetical protein Ate01nite_70610 [Actinoplanes teichomyceticus]